jgi:hypothetical protein
MFLNEQEFMSHIVNLGKQGRQQPYIASCLLFSVPSFLARPEDSCS